MRLFCRIFGHRRSRRRARPFADQWRSRCKNCDTHLIRLENGEWQVADRRIFCTGAGSAGMTSPPGQSGDPDSHRRQLQPAAPASGGQFKSPRKANRHVHWNASRKELRIALNDDHIETDPRPITLRASREVQIGIFIGRLEDDLGPREG